MALSERDRPYETLIRHHEDGSIGAHHVRINEILRDGVVMQASVGNAVPLSVADGQGGLRLSEVLGEATTQALKENERLTVELAASVQSVQQLSGELQSSASSLEASHALTQEQAARISEYQAINSDLGAQIQLLKRQLAEALEPKEQAASEGEQAVEASA